ncbi:DUF1365 domain-containing protein [Aureliella helgolandensis]|uniref:DUF1365 domain-containing protein n=1 Tax=Aureliella helgolandensis TaxID=2527968 RepID=A0A518G3U7_9BACT|nr:DUF1365 domain-containing protein [Aureliella helgolandensis]QDV23245.1 hypothetical protein Q31a_15430 [Aureliella helgolandensis]
MHSCIYEGTVSHRRHVPLNHQFQYRLYMVYLDLDEIPAMLGSRALLGNRATSVRSFLRGDHLFKPDIPLATEVRSLVLEQTGCETTGPIRLLTQLRNFGYYMSPLNLYYCFDAEANRVEAVVAEVNNTPWKERHCYVLWKGNQLQESHELTFSHPKDFHVSPFMDMEMQYRWRLSQPEATLQVRLANTRDSSVEFEADLALQRRSLDRQNLRRMSLRYPMMTAKICAAIYFQALKLWWKKCPSHTHPKKRSSSTQTTQCSSPLRPAKESRVQ